MAGASPFSLISLSLTFTDEGELKGPRWFSSFLLLLGLTDLATAAKRSGLEDESIGLWRSSSNAVEEPGEVALMAEA